MKLALFGATGATGQCLVEQALDQGYDVTAFARNPLALPTGHARLSIAHRRRVPKGSRRGGSR